MAECLIIKMIPEWNDFDPDCSKCSICDDIIVGRQWELYLFFEVNNEPQYNIAKPVLKACTSCYNCLKDGV